MQTAKDDRLAAEMLPRAAALAVAVADEDATAIHNTLTALSTRELYALAVVLAAHVDADMPLQRRTPAGDALEAARHAASAFGVDLADVMGTVRRREVLDARAVAYYAAYLVGQNYSQIGRSMGRDHTSVMHGCARVGENPRLRTLAHRVAERLGWDRAVEEATA